MIGLPDISPADNADLGAAAQALASALSTVQTAGFAGDRWRGLMLRLVLKYAGENVTDEELRAMLAEAEAEGPGDGGEPAE